MKQQELPNLLNQPNERELSLLLSKTDHSSLTVQKTSPKNGMKVTLVTGLEELQRQRRLIKNTTLWIAGGTIFLCLWFSLFLSRNLSKPIRKLTEAVNKIASGQFEQEIALNNNDEFGHLARAITSMSQQIQNLLKERLKVEQNIRETEIKLLQSQINPHFLHNTLNSIKWMATLQGAEGIRDMVSSLGRLLRAVMGNINEKIPLKEELALLDDYIHIQRIRYRGKLAFRLEVQDNKGSSSLLKYLIPKFTLQPLVENAVFHGIEPKEGAGQIVVSVQVCDQNLEISVWDDGVGIQSDKLSNLLNPKANNKVSSLAKGIGLRNIQNRIRLIYGEEYGLRIDSVENEFTRVTIFIPLEVMPNVKSANS